MYKIKLTLLFLLLLSGFAITTHATPEQKPFLSLSLANKIVAAAMQQCERDGFQVSVAVVDQSGVDIIHCNLQMNRLKQVGLK